MKILVIGHPEAVLGFSLAGVGGRVATTAEEVNQALDEAQASKDVGIVLVTQDVAKLVAAFYRRVPTDDVLGPMYPPDDLANAEQRLRDFMIYRLGGPQRYIEQRGHPRLRARHMPFRINKAARDRWMKLMEEAMMETSLPVEAEQFLRTFLDGMSTFLINQE